MDYSTLPIYTLYVSGDPSSVAVKQRLTDLAIAFEIRDIRGNSAYISVLQAEQLRHVPQLRTPAGDWVGDYEAIMSFLDTRYVVQGEKPLDLTHVTSPGG